MSDANVKSSPDASTLKGMGSILKLLNKMNISLSKVIVHVSKEKCDKEIMDSLNIVMNGITSLTKVYDDAYGSAVMAQNSSNRATDVVTHKRSKAELAVFLDSEKNKMIDKIKDVTKSIDNVVGTISNNVKDNADAIDTNKTEKIVTSSLIEQMLGDYGLLFSHLSPRLHPVGKGQFYPSSRFPLYRENIIDASFDDLPEYPEGFYDTREDSVPGQWFLRSGNTEYLWLFNKPDSPLLVRNNGEWTRYTTLPQSAMKLLFTILSEHLKTIVN